MCRVYLEDQLADALLVILTLSATYLSADPRAVVATVGDQHPAQPLHTEPVTAGTDEHEALSGRALVQQRRRLAQDLTSWPTLRSPIPAA